jgi:hypothetical protein
VCNKLFPRFSFAKKQPLHIPFSAVSFDPESFRDIRFRLHCIFLLRPHTLSRAVTSSPRTPFIVRLFVLHCTGFFAPLSILVTQSGGHHCLLFGAPLNALGLRSSTAVWSSRAVLFLVTFFEGSRYVHCSVRPLPIALTKHLKISLRVLVVLSVCKSMQSYWAEPKCIHLPWSI